MKTIILEERGYFWWHDEPIPEDHFAPESYVTGVLKIDDEGRVELELDGMLSGDDNPFGALVANGKSIPPGKCIQGKLKSSNNFVLLNGLLKSGGQFKSNGISYERYLAINCLVGSTSFPRTETLSQFRNLQVDLKGFEEWLRLGSIETTRTKSSITTKYKAPKDLSYTLGDGKLTIEYDISGPYHGNERRHGLTLTESASICYILKKRASLEEMKTQYGLIEDLFILLTDSDYCLDWPLLSCGKGKKKYRLYFLRNRSSATAPGWYECWTNFAQLHESFGQIFSTWKTKRETFGPGFYLYLGTRRGIKLYAEHRFVNLIWGIESLHRRKAPVSRIPSNLKNKIQRILGQVTDMKDKSWLEKRLDHADEPALEQRIFETFQGLPLNLDAKRLRQFAADCARSRNDISHFGGQRQTGNYREFVASIDKKSNALSYLYHTLLLQEIGVDEKILRWGVYEGFRSYTIKSALIDVGLL